METGKHSRAKGHVSEERVRNFKEVIWELRANHLDGKKIRINDIFTKHGVGKMGKRRFWHIVERVEPPTDGEIKKILQEANEITNEYNIRRRQEDAATQLQTDAKEKTEPVQKDLFSSLEVEDKLHLIRSCIDAGARICIIF